MESICHKQGAARWADCTPEYGLYLKRIDSDFPDARILHVVRDGRDVALSLGRQNFIQPLPWHRGDREVSAGAYWAWINQKITEASQAFGDRYLRFKYESLCDNYKKSLNEISEFIGKPIDPATVERNRIGSVETPNSSFSRAANTEEQSNQPRWKTGYSERKLAFVEAVLGNELVTMEYNPHSTRRASEKLSLYAWLNRSLYYMRFSLGLSLRNLALIQRQRIEIPPASTEPSHDDPTLRPGENMSKIREIIES